MSIRKDFEPTTIAELARCAERYGCDPKTEIRIFSSSSEEWCVLSVYMKDGDIYLDIEQVDA